MNRSKAQAFTLAVVMAALASAAIPTRAAEVDDAVLHAEAQRVEVMRRARQATVAIFARGGRGGGSGVVISPDGFCLSNYHVTSGAGDSMKCGMADGQLYDAVIVGIDPTGDVALVKLIGRDDFPYAPLADSDTVRAGDWVFAAGNPFLLAMDFQATISYGIVSGVHRYQYPAGTLLEYADCIQADAAINPGNSGGPLFNMRGEVIGINGRGSFEKRGRVNVGVGYAISINQIKNFMGHLKSGRIVDHATLGAQFSTNRETGRVLADSILESSDAWRRGLRYGDELTEFGGRRITTTNAFKNVLGIFPKGWRVSMTFRRGDKVYHEYVRLAGVHREGELAEKLGAKKKQPRPKKPAPNPKKPGPDDPEAPDPKAKAEAMPAAVAKFYEARKGYANYYFNRQSQLRLWKALQSLGDMSGDWTITGEVAGNLEAKFGISDTALAATLPGGKARLEVDPQDPKLTANLDPAGSGGMFSALYLWRRFMTTGVEKFGSVEYVGMTPLSGHEQRLVDCLRGSYGGAECHFLVDAEQGHLLAMEMWAEEGLDPCEIYFLDYTLRDGRQTPTRLEVRFAGSVYQVFKLTGFRFDQSGEK